MERGTNDTAPSSANGKRPRSDDADQCHAQRRRSRKETCEQDQYDGELVKRILARDIGQWRNLVQNTLNSSKSRSTSKTITKEQQQQCEQNCLEFMQGLLERVVQSFPILVPACPLLLEASNRRSVSTSNSQSCGITNSLDVTSTTELCKTLDELVGLFQSLAPEILSIARDRNQLAQVRRQALQAIQYIWKRMGQYQKNLPQQPFKSTTSAANTSAASKSSGNTSAVASVPLSSKNTPQVCVANTTPPTNSQPLAAPATGKPANRNVHAQTQATRTEGSATNEVSRASVAPMGQELASVNVLAGRGKEAPTTTCQSAQQDATPTSISPTSIALDQLQVNDLISTDKTTNTSQPVVEKRAAVPNQMTGNQTQTWSGLEPIPCNDPVATPAHAPPYSASHQTVAPTGGGTVYGSQNHTPAAQVWQNDGLELLAQTAQQCYAQVKETADQWIRTFQYRKEQLAQQYTPAHEVELSKLQSEFDWTEKNLRRLVEEVNAARMELNARRPNAPALPSIQPDNWIAERKSELEQFTQQQKHRNMQPSFQVSNGSQSQIQTNNANIPRLNQQGIPTNGRSSLDSAAHQQVFKTQVNRKEDTAMAPNTGNEVVPKPNTEILEQAAAERRVHQQASQTSVNRNNDVTSMSNAETEVVPKPKTATPEQVAAKKREKLTKLLEGKNWNKSGARMDCVEARPDGRKGGIPYTHALKEREETRSLLFKRIVMKKDDGLSVLERLQKWDPFWVFEHPVMVGEMCTVATKSKAVTQPHTASKIVVKVTDDLVSSGTQLNQLVPRHQWGKARSARPENALLLRMLPIGQKSEKRADCHLWPKGTFVQVNGKPTEIVQRKQQSHDPRKWLSLSKPLDLVGELSDPEKLLTIEICSHDTEKYAYCLSICKYRNVESLFDYLTKPGSDGAINKISRDSGLVKLKGYTNISTFSVDDEDCNEKSEEVGKFVFSLKCPISKRLLKTPVRGKACRHWQVSLVRCCNRRFL